MPATLGRLGVVLLAVIVVGVAHRLAPSPCGTGTHTQLWLPPCGFKVVTGLPCPSCGMTTACAHMAHFEIARGFSVQPFGAGLFLAVVAAGIIALYCAVFNRSLLGIAERVFTVRTGILIAIAFGITWIVQIARALAAR